MIFTEKNAGIDLQFATDVTLGLLANPKTLPSKYFYDKKGVRIFQQIMAMPTYYLTGAELEIITAHKKHLLQTIGVEPFNLIELGAGDGLKSKVLLRHFIRQGADVKYFPIDISEISLAGLKDDLSQLLPRLPVDPRPGDYLDSLQSITRESSRRNVVLFLGSSIGNMTLPDAGEFLRKVAACLHPQDFLLTGFDLKKDPRIILDAYNDPAGITRDFNLNLLKRINRELGGNFNPDTFSHWETYDPVTGEAKSHLVSRTAQEVSIEAVGHTFSFGRWETIRTEVSQKYSLENIKMLAVAAGFNIVAHYRDKRNYFLDSLWKKKH